MQNDNALSKASLGGIAIAIAQASKKELVALSRIEDKLDNATKQAAETKGEEPKLNESGSMQQRFELSIESEPQEPPVVNVTTPTPIVHVDAPKLSPVAVENDQKKISRTNARAQRNKRPAFKERPSQPASSSSVQNVVSTQSSQSEDNRRIDQSQVSHSTVDDHRVNQSQSLTTSEKGKPTAKRTGKSASPKETVSSTEREKSTTTLAESAKATESTQEQQLAIAQTFQAEQDTANNLLEGIYKDSRGILRQSNGSFASRKQKEAYDKQKASEDEKQRKEGGVLSAIAGVVQKGMGNASEQVDAVDTLGASIGNTQWAVVKEIKGFTDSASQYLEEYNLTTKEGRSEALQGAKNRINATKNTGKNVFSFLANPRKFIRNMGTKNATNTSEESQEISGNQNNDNRRNSILSNDSISIGDSSHTAISGGSQSTIEHISLGPQFSSHSESEAGNSKSNQNATSTQQSNQTYNSGRSRSLAQSIKSIFNGGASSSRSNVGITHDELKTSQKTQSSNTNNSSQHSSNDNSNHNGASSYKVSNVKADINNSTSQISTADKNSPQKAAISDVVTSKAHSREIRQTSEIKYSAIDTVNSSSKHRAESKKESIQREAIEAQTTMLEAGQSEVVDKLGDIEKAIKGMASGGGGSGVMDALDSINERRKGRKGRGRGRRSKLRASSAESDYKRIKNRTNGKPRSRLGKMFDTIDDKGRPLLSRAGKAAESTGMLSKIAGGGKALLGGAGKVFKPLAAIMSIGAIGSALADGDKRGAAQETGSAVGGLGGALAGGAAGAAIGSVVPVVGTAIGGIIGSIVGGIGGDILGTSAGGSLFDWFSSGSSNKAESKESVTKSTSNQSTTFTTTDNGTMAISHANTTNNGTSYSASNGVSNIPVAQVASGGIGVIQPTMTAISSDNVTHDLSGVGEQFKPNAPAITKAPPASAANVKLPPEFFKAIDKLIATLKQQSGSTLQNISVTQNTKTHRSGSGNAPVSNAIPTEMDADLRRESLDMR